MTERDWGFAIGELGDPLADVSDWMLHPYPQCLIDDGFYKHQLSLFGEDL